MVGPSVCGKLELNQLHAPPSLGHVAVWFGSHWEWRARFIREVSWPSATEGAAHSWPLPVSKFAEQELISCLPGDYRVGGQSAPLWGT